MKSKLLTSSMLIAAAVAFNVLAFAEDLREGSETVDNAPTGKTYNANSTGTADAAGKIGQWIGQDSGQGATYDVGNMVLTGSSTGNGIVGFFTRRPTGQTEGSTINLQNLDASGYTGRLTAINAWNNDTIVQIAGTRLSNVEYVFGTVSRDPGNTVNANAWKRLLGLGEGVDKADYTLRLMGATTLQGITGSSKGAVARVNNVDYVLNSLETLTADTTGTTLTLAGAGTYAHITAPQVQQR